MKRRLLVQVGIVTSLFLAVVMILFAAILLYVSASSVIEAKNEGMERDMEAVYDDIVVYNNCGDVFDYCLENIDDFKVPIPRKRLAEIMEGLIFADDPAKMVFDDMDPVKKRVIAEVYYETYSNTLTEHKDMFGYDNICILAVDNTGNAAMVLKNMNNSEEIMEDRGGARKCLGEKPDYEIGNSEKLKKICIEKTAVSEFEIKYRSTGKDYYLGFRHLTDTEKYHYVLAFSYDVSEIFDIIDHLLFPTVGVSALIIILINVLLMTFLYFRVIRPITKIQRNVRIFTDTKNTELVVRELSGEKKSNEIGMLSRDIVNLAEEIDRYTNENIRLAGEQQRAAAELDMAAKIQMSQLQHQFPAFPDRNEFDIFASMTPAKEVGGDFYDMFMIDDDHLAIVIADVSGKGVPAALFMMICKILIDNYALYGRTPAVILGAVNDRICLSNDDNMFVTVWLGILEISTGKLTCCNAGHEYPALKRADGRFGLIDDKHGLFIGTMPGVPYKDYEVMLVPGDTIFVYTDGVPEATNKELELYGTERMTDALDHAGSGTPEELLRSVKTSVDMFVGDAPQFDDITMLALRYNGCGTKARKITLTAVNENCAEATQMVLSLLELNGYDSDKLKMQVEVTVEEIFVNIASYAYNGEPGEVTLTARISGDPESLTVVFEDGGAPFDPLSKKDPDLSIPIEERRIGGLGIYLIKDNMDDIRYEYKGRKNVLTITKILTREQQ